MIDRGLHGLKERLRVAEDMFNRSGVHESNHANISALEKRDKKKKGFLNSMKALHCRSISVHSVGGDDM